MQETQVWSLGWENSLEKGMTTKSSIFAWRIPWTEEPGRHTWTRLGSTHTHSHPYGTCSGHTHTYTPTHTHTHRPLWHLLRAKLSCIGGSGRGQVASSWWCWRRLQRQTKSPAASALRLCQGPRETLADAPQSRFGRKAEWCFELRCVCLPRTRRWCISAGC